MAIHTSCTGNKYRKLQRDNVQRVRDCVTLCPMQDVLSTSSPHGSGNYRKSRKIVEPVGIEGIKKTRLSKHKRTGKEESTKKISIY